MYASESKQLWSQINQQDCAEDRPHTFASLTAPFLCFFSSEDSPLSLGCAADAEVVRL